MGTEQMTFPFSLSERIMRTFYIVSIRCFERNVYLHAKFVFEVMAKETST